jgi:hypothetical protein
MFNIKIVGDTFVLSEKIKKMLNLAQNWFANGGEIPKASATTLARPVYQAAIAVSIPV